MKVVVVGTRGIPNILGGVETHCEELFPRLAAKGVDVTVIRRTPYVLPDNEISSYKGVKLIDIFAPHKKSLEAFCHTFLAVIRARFMNPDILHIHAIGPSIMVPFARLLGMKVVMTHHGADYDRQKWGRLAKTVLKTGERFGAKYSNRVIVISRYIADSLSRLYGRDDTTLIYNGVNLPKRSRRRDWLDKWGLSNTPYIVAVGRFVKEKGFHDLIEAYTKSGLQEHYKLVIAGDADFEDDYSRALRQQAAEAEVILTGFIKGEPLNQLLTNASVYVMSSYHEGLPIALLEAMSYGLDIIVSDIPANRLAEISPRDLFPVGDTDALAAKLIEKAQNPPRHRRYDLTNYDWDHIADQTLSLYRSLAPNK